MPGMARLRQKRGRGFPAVFLGLLAGTLVLLYPLFSPAAPPGTVITNVAIVVSPPDVPPPGLSSNPTTVTVDNAVTDIWDPLTKSVEPAGQVTPGITLRYTNTIGNAGTVPATNVAITDNLDARLSYVVGSATLPQGISGATVAYDTGSRTITWTIPTVPAGYTGSVSFQATVDPATPSDTAVPNAIAVVSDQTPAPKVSNVVTSVVVDQQLRISKAASRAEAEVGDTVVYLVRVENGSGTMTADNVVVTDVLPFGFRFVKGSSAIDNAAVTDPAGGTRPAWAIGPMPPGAVRTLRYRALASVDAPRGDGVNSASVAGRTPGGNLLAAGPARVRIKIREGVLSSRGVVLGRVFLDRNGDRMPGADEPGFAGVRIYLEDGSFAETDKEGKYSLYGIAPGEHVLKLDRSTVPPGLNPVPLDSTFAGDGGSRFVSLPFGGNARGDFALLPSPSHDNNCLPRDGGEKNVEGRLRVFGTETNAAPPSLEVLIQGMPQTPEILEPADGVTLSHPYSDIAVRVPEGVSDTLRVNGLPVDRKSIGKKIHESARRITIYRYVGVNLAPGQNTIALETHAPDGEKVVQRITVIVQGPPARVLLSPERSDVPADGGAAVPFTATLLDAWGKPSGGEQVVTVVLAKGKVDGPDLDPSTPGHQVKARDGRATFTLRGTGGTGEEKVRVLVGSELSASADVYYTPAPRPWVVAGIADVTAGANKAGGDTGNASGKETFKDGFVHKERLAVFAKGTVGNGYLLTGTYDTGKERPDGPFQRVEPERYYPMYGDASRIGYEAASRDKLFLKAEKDRSSILYGDYRTDLTRTEFARYDRAFTGVKADVDAGRWTVRAFGAESDQVLTRDDIPGNGTSGFYFLTRRPAVENSERVRIEVRDRYHPERVLSTAEKIPFVDYGIDYAAGSILFKQPVPSLDPGLNPVYVVVLYENRSAGSEFFTYGGRAGLRLGKAVEVGVTAVREDRDLVRASLDGADASVRFGDRLLVKGEIAGSDTAAKGKGTAWKVESEGAVSAKTKGTAYYRDVGRNFENPSAQGGESGTVKYGGKLDYRPTALTGAAVDGYIQEDKTRKAKFTSLTGSVSRKHDRLTLDGGYRFLREERTAAGEADTNSRSVFAAGGYRVTDRLTGNLRHEQLLASSGIGQYRTETTAGVEYRVTDQVKASLTETFRWSGEKRNATLLGLESQLTKSTTLSSRYEIENTSSGQRMQSLIGFNHQWSPRKELKLDGRAEWIDSLRGANAVAEGIALALAAEYLPREDVKATGRSEVRFGKDETTTLFSLGAGIKLTPDFGLLGRLELWNANRDQGDSARYDAMAGVAYRPKGVRSIYLLDTVRFKLDRSESIGGKSEAKSLVTSNEVSWRVQPRLTLMGKYAGKYAWESFEGTAYGSYTDLLIAGAAYDLTDRWDVGGQARLMNQYTVKASELSAVVRTGYRIVKNLYAGVGYNFARLNDRDLSGAGWQSHGPFVEVKFKFDEATLHLPGWNDTPKPPLCPPAAPAPAPIPVPKTVPTVLLPAPVADNIVLRSGRIDRPIDVIGNVEMLTLLVNGSEVPLPAGDVFLQGHLPDGSLRFEGSSSGEPVRFRTELAATGSPSAWKLLLQDARGEPVRAMTGAGAPPPEISWDGRTEDGRHVEGGALYRYRLEVSYFDKSVSTSGQRTFAVNRVSAVSLKLTGSAFEFNSAVLSAKARKALKETASVLMKHPEEKVTVEGHTDGIGTERYNLDLSRRRAEAAVEFLVAECGIPADRFLVRWYGKSRPVAGNDTPAGRELNRRVELSGEFRETQRAAVRDRYRTMPAVRINRMSLDVDPLGRFRTTLPADTERIDVEMVTSEGRSVRTSLGLPSIRIENPSGTVRLPPGANGDGYRFFPFPAEGAWKEGDPAGTYRVSGRTEPGNAVDLYGTPVPPPEGIFAVPLDVRSGGNLLGFEVRNPSGLMRILHLDLDVSREPGKEAMGR